MFNSLTEQGMILKRRILGEEILRGIDSCNFPKEYFQSFLPCDLSEEQLEEKYGLKAQNKALEKVRKLKKDKFVNSIKEYYNKEINTQTRINKIKTTKENQIDIENDER